MLQYRLKWFVLLHKTRCSPFTFPSVAGKFVPLVLPFCFLHVETLLHPRILIFINFLSSVQHVQVGDENEESIRYVLANWPKFRIKRNRKNQSFFCSRISESWFPMFFFFASSLLSNHTLASNFPSWEN